MIEYEELLFESERELKNFLINQNKDLKKKLVLEKLKVEIFALEYISLIKHCNKKMENNKLTPYFILEPPDYIDCVSEKAKEKYKEIYNIEN